MASIGLVPGSFRPYHAGHDALVRLAAQENDVVYVFASLSDRDNVSGAAMEKIWKDQIEPSLPDNVTVVYGGSPVRQAFALLGKASEEGSQDAFNVYSDPDDVGRLSADKIAQYAPNLVGRVHARGIKRTDTVNISGTRMRELLASGDKDEFVRYLPPNLDADLVWDQLVAAQPAATPKRGRSKKRPKNEALLRSYIRYVIRG